MMFYNNNPFEFIGKQEQSFSNINRFIVFNPSKTSFFLHEKNNLDPRF